MVQENASLANGRGRIELLRGDLTRENVDAIVNAANSSLLGGGGVDGAIHRAGGRKILEECRRIRSNRGSLPPGEAVITTAGNLPSRYVIHTVGPVWQGGDAGEADILARCYRNTLALAQTHGLRSIAFPSISTGAFGYPVSCAAPVALDAVSAALESDSSIDLVRFVLFTASDLAAYRTALANVRG
jgi:O-acetyl-ADP-ribose deacetylase (regulator of RNase III)